MTEVVFAGRSVDDILGRLPWSERGAPDKGSRGSVGNKWSQSAIIRLQRSALNSQTSMDLPDGMERRRDARTRGMRATQAAFRGLGSVPGNDLRVWPRPLDRELDIHVLTIDATSVILRACRTRYRLKPNRPEPPTFLAARYTG